MEQDILKPEKAPKTGVQAFSPFGCFLAALGAALLSLSLLGATAAASAWAIVKLFGLPDTFLYVLLAALAIPVIWATVWTGGRAWHIERRLAQGFDIDTPIFKFAHYLKG